LEQVEKTKHKPSAVNLSPSTSEPTYQKIILGLSAIENMTNFRKFLINPERTGLSEGLTDRGRFDKHLRLLSPSSTKFSFFCNRGWRVGDWWERLGVSGSGKESGAAGVEEVGVRG
jgi:hypothetical protein